MRNILINTILTCIALFAVSTAVIYAVGVWQILHQWGIV